jgi:hypothetical protein
VEWRLLIEGLLDSLPHFACVRFGEPQIQGSSLLQLLLVPATSPCSCRFAVWRVQPVTVTLAATYMHGEPHWVWLWRMRQG